MIVRVRLSGALRRYRPANAPGAPHQPFPLDLPVKSDVAALLATLKLPAGSVSALAINGAVAELNHVVREGDLVVLVPPAAGG